MPEEGVPVGPRFWLLGQGIWVVRRGLSASTKARGKAPTMDPLPPEMDEELARWLQWEEIAAEEVAAGV